MTLWAQLANATLRFQRVLTIEIDPNTGNEIPATSEFFTIDAYFKKASLVRDEGKGVPIGSYKVSGYCDGILPDWCNEPTASKVQCTVKHLGSGWFHYDGKIAVVRDEVESIGEGTPIQGYFVLEGSG